jgi:hypothetical protein
MCNFLIAIFITFLFGGSLRPPNRPAGNGKTARKIGGTAGGHRHRRTVHRGANGDVRWYGTTVRSSIETRLNEIFALWLCDERLELCGSEGVHQAGFGYYQK